MDFKPFIKNCQRELLKNISMKIMLFYLLKVEDVYDEAPIRLLQKIAKYTAKWILLLFINSLILFPVFIY